MGKTDVFIGLGSNIGDRLSSLRNAVNALSGIVEIIKVSNLYVAAPISYVGRNTFVNGVVLARTALAPFELLHELQEIEITLGRQPGVQYGPRPIDLDILFYGALEIDAPMLKIPHPLIPKRAFVLKPLVEIAPTFVHPVLFYTMAQLLEDVEDAQQVQLFRAA